MEELKEAILTSIQLGTFQKDYDVLRLKATELGISDADFQRMVQELKVEAQKRTEAQKKLVNSNKRNILIAIVVCLVIELFIPIGWIGKLILMVVTVAVVVFVASMILSKKIK